MTDPKSLNLPASIIKLIVKATTVDDEKVWETIEVSVINECLIRKIEKHKIKDLFLNFPIGKRLVHKATFSQFTPEQLFEELYTKVEEEYEKWKIDDRSNLEDVWKMKVAKTEVIMGENPMYILTLNSHGSLQLTAAELMYQGKFHLKFLATFHRKLIPMEPEAWQRLTGYWLENVEKTESDMVSQSGAIYEFLNEFISEVSDDEKEQLARLRLGEVVEYEDGIAFRSEAFRKYLDKAKLSIAKNALFRILREAGWKPILVGPETERLRCWWKEERVNKEEPKDVDTLLKTDDGFNS